MSSDEQIIREKLALFKAELLQEKLLRQVEREPGRAPSYYCRVPLKEGGIRGSQERKEKALSALLSSGRLVEVPLPRRQGRKTRGIWLTEQKSA